MSGLSLEEENDMRVEHALEILKADVSHFPLSALYATASLQQIICLVFGVTACPTQTHKYSVFLPLQHTQTYASIDTTLPPCLGKMCHIMTYGCHVVKRNLLKM